MGGKAVEMTTLVLLATVVPRTLGPAAYGRFSVPLTIVTLGALAMTLGGPMVLARFVPVAEPERRVAVARAIGGRLARGRAIQVGAIAVAAALLSAVDPTRFPPATVAAIVVALALNVATGLALQVVLGLGQAGPWSTRWPLQNTVLVAAVLVLEPRYGDGGAVAAIVLASMVGTAFAAVVLRPVVAVRTEPAAVPDGAMRFGAYQATGAALTQFAQRGGVLAVAVLTGSGAGLATPETETAYAALAIGIALGATYAILQAFTVSLPHLADRSTSDRSTDGSEAVLRRLAGALMAVVVPGAVVGALLLDRLVPVAFGDDYRGAAPAFGPALALVVLAPVGALVVQAAALRLRPEVTFVAGVAAAVGFVVTSLLAVPAHGAVGATAAALVGGVAGTVAATHALPGAVGGRVGAVTVVGVVAVAALAAVTT